MFPDSLEHVVRFVCLLRVVVRAELRGFRCAPTQTSGLFRRHSEIALSRRLSVSKSRARCPGLFGRLPLAPTPDTFLERSPTQVKRQGKRFASVARSHRCRPETFSQLVCSELRFNTGQVPRHLRPVILPYAEQAGRILVDKQGQIYAVGGADDVARFPALRVQDTAFCHCRADGRAAGKFHVSRCACALVCKRVARCGVGAKRVACAKVRRSVGNVRFWDYLGHRCNQFSFARFSSTRRAFGRAEC
jgi:hypothetical protein